MNDQGRKEKNPLPAQMTSRKDALDKLFAVWTPPREAETVPLEAAVGRTLAETQYSRLTMPPSHVSICDGIAVRSADFAQGNPDASGWIEGREYVWADTGDDFPDDYDAVIRVEELERLPGGGLRITRAESVESGDSVKPRGGTVCEGDKLLDAGLVIRPTDLSALAMGGVFTVPVWRKPRVAFLPTGSELIPCGQTPKRGENIDSNSLMVPAMLEALGAEALRFPITRDAPALLRETLLTALSQADIVIINGGSSKGGEDFNTRLIAEEGTLLFHEVSAAPGRPTAIGIVRGKPVVNMPGPPLAAYFVTDWCMRAILDRWLCHSPRIPHTVRGTLTAPIEQGGRVETFRRLQAERNEDGSIALMPLHGKGRKPPESLSSNAQYTVGFFEPRHEAGEELEVELLR